MGVSDANNIPFVATELQRLNPQSILEVGVGFGKWGVVAREYLEAWQGRFRREEWRVRIEGIEIFEGYRNPVWAAVYDQIYLGDAAQLLNALGKFDVGLICDVIEHIEKPAGRNLIDQLLTQCQTVILTTPLSFWPQGEEHGNVSQKHLCLWRPEDFREYDGYSVELGATFAAVIQKKTGKEPEFRVQQRFDRVGVRPLLRALMRRTLLKMSGHTPDSL
ncbi:MAG: hypothetical protein WB729_02160 [Candidatus Sulfotelmatobacter sp.]